MSLVQFFVKTVLKEGYTEKRAQFLASLMQSSLDGHLCLYESNDPELPDWVLEQNPEKIPSKPVICQEGRYYLQRNWVIETHIIEELKRLQSLSLAKIEPKTGLEFLLPMQKQAVLNALEHPFSIICGGPGTGKTFTAAALIRSFLKEKSDAKVIVAAPTGKAASHFSQILGAQVQTTTLHRLLKVAPNELKLFSKRKIDADLVIVDEASMVDVTLLAKLLESVSNETRLILMGDPDQLPPVEAGSVFKELSEVFGTRLEKSMRTDNLQIQTLAASVNEGQWSLMPQLPWAFDAKIGERLYQKIDPIFSWQKPEPQSCLDQLNRFRILGALRQGPFGTDALNHSIVQEMGRQIKPGQWWQVPIMITKNCPDQDLYNGTCGVLIGQSRGGLFLKDGVGYFPHAIPFRSLPPFEIAFCLSIHKSQGSEFEHVLALFPEGSENFGKEALYTAITRAKKQIEILGAESTLKAMLAKSSSKISGIRRRLEFSLL